MRAMDDVSGEAVQPHAPTPGVMVTDLSNRSAITALVLGITSVVLLPAFAIGLWASLDEVELDAWLVILFLISLVAAICAGLFGMQGRRLANVGAPGRVTATIGLVLGSIVVLVFGVIVGLIAFAFISSHDYI
jgi:hypothetical protein